MQTIKRTFGWLGTAIVVVLIGCGAHLQPQELSDANAAYQRVAAGPAASVAPDELHKAKVALDQAEQAFVKDPDGQSARDLAYVAHRKALLAEAKAGIKLAEQERAQADQQKAKTTEQELERTKEQLKDAERARQTDAERRAADEKIKAEQGARAEAERKADAAMQDLARIAAMREEERGMVLTFPSDLLFASNQWTLLPSAQMKLNQLADALANTDKRIVVEGHTDARGSETYNQDLSLKRAQAVRDFLIGRGIAAERIQVNGYGKSRPVADNKSAEGRANNRRVEVVVTGERRASAKGGLQ